MSKMKKNESIWNLGGGDFFFTGNLILCQNSIKKSWKGKYVLDTLDSLAKQFNAQSEGKHFSEFDRYTVWMNYKERNFSNDELVSKMLDDLPDDFIPQRDCPDFYDYVNGRSFLLKNNYIEVITTTAVIKDDFASLLHAAQKIVSSFYSEESPANFYLTRNKILQESIDVENVKKMNDPESLDIELTSEEANENFFSFQIYFDMEISYKLAGKDSSHNRLTEVAPLILDNFDYVPLFVERMMNQPSEITLDKKNCFYFKNPVHSDEWDLIYAEKIVRGLMREFRYDYDCALEFYWLVYYAKQSIEKIEESVSMCIETADKIKAVQNFIQKYGGKGKISKSKIMTLLKNGIDSNPLNFLDSKIPFVSLYAKHCINGDTE